MTTSKGKRTFGDFTSQHRYTGREGCVVDLFWNGSAGGSARADGAHGKVAVASTVVRSCSNSVEVIILFWVDVCYSRSNTEGTTFHGARLCVCTWSTVAWFI